MSLLRPVLLRFQSTPPARGATRSAVRQAARDSYFNPRPPQGERREAAFSGSHPVCISIHAPRKGSDVLVRFILLLMIYFNPRPPQGERQQ